MAAKRPACSGGGAGDEEAQPDEAPAEGAAEGQGDAKPATEAAKPPADPETMSASHVLVAYQGAMRADPAITRSKDEAATQIADLKKQVDGGADFADLARAHSDCPSGQQGGDLGRFGKGQMVPARPARWSERMLTIPPSRRNPMGPPMASRLAKRVTPRLRRRSAMMRPKYGLLSGR